MARRLQITGVRLERVGSHDHISHVRFGTSGILSRAIVVADLLDPDGDRYYTKTDGKEAEVVVVRCPNCSDNDYIRTKAGSTTADNLLSLPKI